MGCGQRLGPVGPGRALSEVRGSISRGDDTCRPVSGARARPLCLLFATTARSARSRASRACARSTRAAAAAVAGRAGGLHRWFRVDKCEVQQTTANRIEQLLCDEAACGQRLSCHCAHTNGKSWGEGKQVIHPPRNLG
jgi:hypothetical protein